MSKHIQRIRPSQAGSLGKWYKTLPFSTMAAVLHQIHFQKFPLLRFLVRNNMDNFPSPQEETLGL